MPVPVCTCPHQLVLSIPFPALYACSHVINHVPLPRHFTPQHPHPYASPLLSLSLIPLQHMLFPYLFTISISVASHVVPRGSGCSHVLPRGSGHSPVLPSGESKYNILPYPFHYFTSYLSSMAVLGIYWTRPVGGIFPFVYWSRHPTWGLPTSPTLTPINPP